MFLDQWCHKTKAETEPCVEIKGGNWDSITCLKKPSTDQNDSTFCILKRIQPIFYVKIIETQNKFFIVFVKEDHQGEIFLKIRFKIYASAYFRKHVKYKAICSSYSFN